ncbi:MAG: helix-turn-helix transcriptional regulator [Gammaproteobacteria bacterium]
MTDHDKQTVSSGNVFLDMEFAPDEAAHLKIRSELMIQIKYYIKKHKLTQRQVAERLGIAQPDVSAINTGKVQKFTIDKLVSILVKLGHRIDTRTSQNRRTFSIIDDPSARQQDA